MPFLHASKSFLNTYEKIGYPLIELHLSLTNSKFYSIRLSGSKAIISHYLSNYVCSSTTTRLPILAILQEITRQPAETQSQ